jgi:phosphatidylserine decarboxylase
MQNQIQLYNRRTGDMETESVYGRRWMDFFYGNSLGRWITGLVLARRPLSVFYGYLQNRRRSRRKIGRFITQYGIDMNQVVVPPGGFPTFNAFFIRRLKPGARPVDPDPHRFVAPADSRLLVLNPDPDEPIAVKGIHVTLAGLLGLSGTGPPFEGGTVLVFRLAPCDYHRFGHVADGIQGPVHSVHGGFHSVNPLALRHKSDILMTNFRQWCFVHSPSWGTLIQVEVGAMMVGSIVQQKPLGGPCGKGDEKGYFQFGGSSIVLVVEPGRIRVDDDIRQHSGRVIETLVRYGEGVGSLI